MLLVSLTNKGYIRKNSGGRASETEGGPRLKLSVRQAHLPTDKPCESLVCIFSRFQCVSFPLLNPLKPPFFLYITY